MDFFYHDCVFMLVGLIALISTGEALSAPLN